MWARTPVRLMATAGLRLLAAQQAEDILAACREVLASSGFQFHSSWVELISGDMEGLYGWIAVNYATGALQVRAAQAGAATRISRGGHTGRQLQGGHRRQCSTR